ncbi:MAG: acyl-CoA dehydratase activase [Clostridiaceae bacterium]
MFYMGIDVGSVSTDIVLIDKNYKVVDGLYLRTKGKPIEAILNGFKILKDKYSDKQITSVGTTGSGRHIASYIIGADAIKNEITTHAVASLNENRNVRTIIEIGGQDSKIITLKNGVVTDFAMNSVCAAGTGSFLDRQAERLDIPIENFGDYALKSKHPVRIAGRCAVFAESDMIHKQQLGYKEEDIINGLCIALARNYLTNVGKGKDIESEIFFQGGVSANIGIKKAFQDILKKDLTIPKYYNMMGAIGAAIIASDEIKKSKNSTNFKGFNLTEKKFTQKSFECSGCPNHCEVVKIQCNNIDIGCFGDRCGKWSTKKII